MKYNLFWMCSSIFYLSLIGCNDGKNMVENNDAGVVTDTENITNTEDRGIYTEDDDINTDDGVELEDDINDNTDDTTDVYVNISEIFGYPRTATNEINSDWYDACQSEIPYIRDVKPPPPSATQNTCAGNSALCGSNNTQNCGESPALSKWLHRVTIDVSSYPDAVCSDGSPGLIEVRPGNGATSNNWLFWFKGGSNCKSQNMCAQRWCGKQSGGKYQADLLSNDWNGDGLIDQAFCKRPETGSALDANLENNPFKNFNVVRIWYCSSDSHIGTTTIHYPDIDFDGDGVTRNFSVYAQGRSIITAALEMLDAGVSSDDGFVTLPSFSNAKEVVISGSSAGAYGAVHNLYMTRKFRNHF